MEGKGVILSFLALLQLSVLLFGCLSFSVLHNARLISELQAKWNAVDSTNYETVERLAAEISALLTSDEDMDAKNIEVIKNRMRRTVPANVSESESALALLTNYNDLLSMWRHNLTQNWLAMN